MPRDDQDERSLSPLMLDDPLSASSSLDSPRFSPVRFASRRRRFAVAAIAVAVFSLFFLFYHSSSRPPLVSQEPASAPSESPHHTPVTPSLDRKSALLGPPTNRFRDNLRNDTKYITSWISAGWTNDVMTYGNLIYLALITERVPIIGPFTPSHVGGSAGNILFGEVFDVDYLSDQIGMPVLEWHEVKNLSTPTPEIEDIGCWSVWQAVSVREPSPRITSSLGLQGLDISWTAGPAWLHNFPGNPHDSHTTFWKVASLLFPPGREESMTVAQPSEVHGAVLPPDEHVACLDYLYYVCALNSFEYQFDMSPAWRFVVKNFRWTNRLQAIADGYLRRMFNIAEHEPIPPYIAIHARRTDFVNYCNGVPMEDCFPSIATYSRRIGEIQAELRERLGITPHHVVMLSDERDPVWWDSIREVGWYAPDHVAEDTANKYGGWYPVLIDAVLQSSGVGLIGMYGSTMSLLAGRRVEDWHNGVYKIIKWGTPNADDEH